MPEFALLLNSLMPSLTQTTPFASVELIKKNDKFPPIKQGKKRNFMSSFFTLLYFKYVDTNLWLNQRHFQCLWTSGQPTVSTNGPSEST